MASLPILGMLLFFQLTQPASHDAPSDWSRKVATIALETAGKSSVGELTQAKQPIRRFDGVSARLSDNQPTIASTPAISSREAGQVFAKVAKARLAVGLQKEYVTPTGECVVLKIVRQDPIGDETISNSAKVLSIAPASSSNVVVFAVGEWRYSVEIAVHDYRTRKVVQESL